MFGLGSRGMAMGMGMSVVDGVAPLNSMLRLLLLYLKMVQVDRVCTCTVEFLLFGDIAFAVAKVPVFVLPGELSQYIWQRRSA